MSSIAAKKAQKQQAIVFESDDTEGSDLSYESSIDLQDNTHMDNENPRNLQLFKEQITRFFINHPELKDNNIIPKTEDTENPIKNSFWGSVASDILNQSKRNSQVPSIEAFAKRLNLYRNKVQRSQIIDIVVKDHATLLKKIDLEIAKKKKRENSVHASIQERLKKQTGDVTYYSWRKNKQLEFRIDKAEQFALSQKKSTKQQSNSMPKGKQVEEKDFKIHNFQPKTEVGRQLQEELKKCSDELMAKKTVINSILRYRQAVARQFSAKPSLLQQGQKYYCEESKEFVLLYPNCQVKKKLDGEQIKQNMDSEAQSDSVNLQFLKILTQVASGNLMSYWKSQQLKKL